MNLKVCVFATPMSMTDGCENKVKWGRIRDEMRIRKNIRAGSKPDNANPRVPGEVAEPPHRVPRGRLAHRREGPGSGEPYPGRGGAACSVRSILLAIHTPPSPRHAGQLCPGGVMPFEGKGQRPALQRQFVNPRRRDKNASRVPVPRCPG